MCFTLLLFILASVFLPASALSDFQTTPVIVFGTVGSFILLLCCAFCICCRNKQQSTGIAKGYNRTKGYRTKASRTKVWTSSGWSVPIDHPSDCSGPFSSYDCESGVSYDCEGGGYSNDCGGGSSSNDCGGGSSSNDCGGGSCD